jgi:hypothetical protein
MYKSGLASADLLLYAFCAGVIALALLRMVGLH